MFHPTDQISAVADYHGAGLPNRQEKDAAFRIILTRKRWSLNA
jgi:hypothetical protein